MSQIQVLSIGVDPVTLSEAVERCVAYMQGTEPRLVVTPNAEIAYTASENPELAQIINGADLVIPDGAGVVLASRILGTPLPEKVAGVDLATQLLGRLAHVGGRVYLLGTRPEIVAEAARRIGEQYPGITVAGYHDGFFTPEEEPEVIAEIRAARVDLLVVGMGSPRQERWLAQHLAALNAKVSIGLGGTIDVWAGASQRAPEWMINANLEWLFRIVKFGRYGRSLPPLIKFVWRVTARRLRGQ